MSQLTKNTADLDALIAKANALPDAGSGGGGSGIETVTVGIQAIWVNIEVNYVNSDGNLVKLTVPETGYDSQVDINVAKNTIMYIGCLDSIDTWDNSSASCGEFMLAEIYDKGYYYDSAYIVTAIEDGWLCIDCSGD